LLVIQLMGNRIFIETFGHPNVKENWTLIRLNHVAIYKNFCYLIMTLEKNLGFFKEMNTRWLNLFNIYQHLILKK